MKRCGNPKCVSDLIFDDDRNVCPFCGSALIDINQTGLANSAPAQDPDRTETPKNEPDRSSFLAGKHFIKCHGIVAEVEHQAIFYGRFHKLCNSIFRGEPYQLAHQTIEYTLRIQRMDDDLPDSSADFNLFGNFMGRIYAGDEVVIRAISHGDRKTVQSIMNLTTGCVLRPGFQIPAALIRGFALATAAFIAYFIYLCLSGTLLHLIATVISAFMPVIILVGLVFLVIRRYKRHHRRWF